MMEVSPYTPWICLSNVTILDVCEYAFEMISSTLRFGIGVTAEIGHDVKQLKSKHPLVVTDKNVANTRAFMQVIFYIV